MLLSKLKSRGFGATSLSTFDFSSLYTTIPHNIKKEKLLDLIEGAFKKLYKNEGTLYLACNDKNAFFTSTDHRGYKLWCCQNVCDALSYLLDNIYIRFGNQRTNGPVNAHLISWPCKAQSIQNLEKYGKEMTLTFNTHIPS